MGEKIVDNLDDDFAEFVLERTLNNDNNLHQKSGKGDDSENDMSPLQLAMQNDIAIIAYKRGFVDAILLFHKI